MCGNHVVAYKNNDELENKVTNSWYEGAYLIPEVLTAEACELCNIVCLQNKIIN